MNDEPIDERYLQVLAFLNRDNKKLLEFVRAAYRAMMNLRLELIKQGALR